MKSFSRTEETPVFVAIDIAKDWHHVLIEYPDGKRTASSVANTLRDFNKLADQLKAASPRCKIALEPTGDYHRPLANFLVRHGHNVQFVSSIATHRTREALFDS
jgi:transposase